MSEINNGILGKMTGSIGNITGKIRNGKNILALKPSSTTIPTDPESVARREKFAQVVKFAKVVNDHASLKLLWQKMTPSDISCFNYIVKTNYPSFLNGSHSANTSITPFMGFPVTTSAAVLAQTGINLTVNPLANAYNFNPELETKIKPEVILSFANPVNTALPSSLFYSVELPVSSFVTDTEITFSVTFNDYVKALFQQYTANSALVALVTLDNNSTPVNYSQTLII